MIQVLVVLLATVTHSANSLQPMELLQIGQVHMIIVKSWNNDRWVAAINKINPHLSLITSNENGMVAFQM